MEFNFSLQQRKTLKKKPFDTIRIQDITTCADISRSTFYLYFTNIYDVVQLMEDELIAGMPIYTPNAQKNDYHFLPSAKDCQTPTWMIDWFDYCLYFGKQLSILLGENGNRQFPQKIRKSLELSLTEQMKNDRMPADRMSEYYTYAMADFQLSILLHWLKKTEPESSMSTAEMAHVVNTFRIGGLYLKYLESAEEKSEL